MPIPPIKKRSPLRLNPEAFRGFIALEDLDDIEIILVKTDKPFWARCVEGVVIHLVGGGVILLLGAVFGLFIGYHQ